MKAGFTPSRLAALFAPKQSSKLAWFEVVAITLGALFVAALSSPGNPLLIDRPFPWLWLAPVLLALRYGTLAALGSAAILFLTWAFLESTGSGSGVFPGQYFLGGLILTLVSGEFSDVWSGRLQRVREVNNYLAQRLDSLTRRHYLLKFSHERLEQDMLVKPVTLRDSLLSLRQLTVEAGGGSGALPEAQELMRILAQACQLEVASIHAEVNGRLQALPAASLGDASAIDPRDPLVIYALNRNELCHVQTETLREADSRYLVAAPLLDASGKRMGVLVIERMPFLSLNPESLQFLSVTLGYYADTVSLAPQVLELMRQLPGCPFLFASELLRLQRIRRDSGVESTIVALVFEAVPQQKNLFAEAVRQRRQLDVAWSLQGSGREVLLTLMPLYGSAAVNGYLLRMERRFQELFGTNTLPEAGIQSLSAAVGEQPAEELLKSLLERCHVR